MKNKCKLTFPGKGKGFNLLLYIGFIGLVFSIFSVLLTSNVYSQQNQDQRRTISGTVMDSSGETIPGATVSVPGTTIGVVTDVEGMFELRVPIDATSISVSFVGMATRAIALDGRTSFLVILEREAVELEEVAVIGYGTQKLISVTGSVSTVRISEVERVSTPSLSNAIAGKLPGIITRQSSGEPGYDAAQVYIRGLSSFVNNAPLILVDGVERDMNNINAHEIESFTILKDASATAVYGVRGANGVILINTKRGEIGKPKVTFRSEAAGLTAMRLPQYIEGWEYASLMNEALEFSGQNPRWSDNEIQTYKDGSNPYLYPNSNWTDAVLNEDTWQTVQNLSINGGSDIFRYFTNVGMTVHDGIYKQDPTNQFSTNANVKRYNFRSNVDVKLSESLSMELNVGGIIQNANYPGFSAPDIFQSLAVISPIAYPVTNPDGTPGGQQAYIGWNPWGRVTQSGYSTQDRSTLQGTFAAKWDLSSLITKGLSLRGMFSYDRFAQTNNIRQKAFEVKRYLGVDPITGEDMYSASFREEQPLGYQHSNSANRAIYSEIQLNYDRTFDRHMVTAMVIGNRREYVHLTAGSSINNLPYRRQGVAGRATYSFDNRYLMEFNFGYNGSENFPKGSQYGFFPSASAGWVVSNESFWNIPFFSHLKFRGSYGLVGNDQIGRRFLFLSSISTSGQSYYFGSSHELRSGMEENAMGNPNVTWETALKRNIGLDVRFFDDRISLQVDAFDEQRENILLQRQTVPTVTGIFPWSIPYGNVGKVDNKGIDALMEVRHASANGWFFSFRSNFTYAKNTVIENDEPYPRFQYLSGKELPLGQPFAFVADGFFESEADIEASPKQIFAEPRVGDVKYKDINGDGIIDAYDQIPVGYPRLPQMSFGFGGTVAYNNFDISLYFTGAAQTSIFLSGISMWPFYDGLGVNNVRREYYDNRWTPDNPDAKYPAIDMGNNPNNFINSTVWMRNGNYLRLRNTEIGYNLPQSICDRIGVASLRFFINGVNLFTWDHIKIMDPESNDGIGGYPLQRSFGGGVLVGFN